MAGRELRVTRDIEGSVDSVWRALTERELLAEWLMPNDFEPVVGHGFTLQADPAPGFDGIVHAELLALEPKTCMLWSWRGGPVDTQVEFRVESVDSDRTRVTVHQYGFSGFRAMVVSAILHLGWRGLIGKSLAGVVARLGRRAA